MPHLSAVVACVATVFLLSSAAFAQKGAKAIFDSGEGPSVGMSVSSPKPSAPAEPVQKERYMGISYQIMLVSDDGQFKAVPKSSVFKSGEKIKLLVRTNKSGYMTIVNVGPTGNTNVVFNEFIEAYTVHEIPKTTNLRFVGAPGTEKLLIMLSDNPNPMGGQQPMTATAPPPSSTGSSAASYDPASLPPPPPATAMSTSIEGSKRIKGSKDIVAEDSMRNSYAVISPQDGWKPKSRGTKDIVLESSQGVNYGVVPVSAVAGGGILTLEVKLKHQ
jgi:hypothetical protein